MSGGEVVGWTPDVSAILWCRMLSALGDVNTLENPALHEQVFQYLLDLNSTMGKVNLYISTFVLKNTNHNYYNFLQIYQNQGLVEEETYVSLGLVPPISIIAPWCFQVN